MSCRLELGHGATLNDDPGKLKHLRVQNAFLFITCGPVVQCFELPATITFSSKKMQKDFWEGHRDEKEVPYPLRIPVFNLRNKILQKLGVLCSLSVSAFRGLLEDPLTQKKKIRKGYRVIRLRILKNGTTSHYHSFSYGKPEPWKLCPERSIIHPLLEKWELWKKMN